MKLICIMKNGSLEIGEMEEIIENVRKKIISSLNKKKKKKKEKDLKIISKIYKNFDDYKDLSELESTVLGTECISSKADLYPHLEKLEKEVHIYKTIKNRKSLSLADLLNAEETLKDMLYLYASNIDDSDIDAEYHKSYPPYKIFKLEYDNIEELRLAFKYYGDIKADAAYNAGYDAGYDA